jgi:hypothetical protein
MIINRIYETQSSVAVVCFLPGRAKDLSAPLCIVELLNEHRATRHNTGTLV